MMNFAWAAHKARQDFLAECDAVYRRSMPSECRKCGAECPCEERSRRLVKSVIEDSERMAGALRRINNSLTVFDSPTYASASAFAGQILLMRQAVDKALNPSRAKAPQAI